MESENSSNFYNPNREDTKQELEKLRSIVEHRLGAFRPIVILGVADVVLWILKCDDHRFNTPIDKRVEVEKLLNPVADQVFEQMLLIAERVTDYSVSTTTDHPYRFGFHDGQPITTMEDIVAYNLLIRVYGDKGQQIDHQKKAFEMLLILKNQSIEPIEAQRKMIGNLLNAISDRVDCGLLVFIISKLFPGFVRRWDKVAIKVIPPKISVNPPATLEGCGSGEGENEKVIDTLPIFTWTWIVTEFATAQAYQEVRESDQGSGGFEESENELGSAGASASASRDFHNHDQRIFKLRRGNGVKLSYGKDERSSSSYQKKKKIFFSVSFH